jgi:hypothetical protein
LPLPGIEPCRAARSPSLYRLGYPGFQTFCVPMKKYFVHFLRNFKEMLIWIKNRVIGTFSTISPWAW